MKMKIFRTATEEQVGKNLEQIFDISSDSTEIKLENFPKYIRRKSVTRFLALYELFKKALKVKGSIVECGVYQGFSLMSWAKMSAVLEPVNLTRRIYGFDTFEGFNSVNDKDQNNFQVVEPGGLASSSYEELQELIQEFDNDRFLGHIPKVQLIKGDATQTIPEFLEKNPHLVISLLFLDFDLYLPTKVALQNFLPRMPKGAILAFDELDNPIWPGETVALFETLGINKLKIRRLEWEPYIGYAILE